jgi:hypothetical protein
MKVALVNIKDKVFLAKNTRLYSLVRKQRKAPAPYAFTSKGKAQDFLRQNQMEGFTLIRPENIKQIEPRQVSVRRYTCGGRKTSK